MKIIADATVVSSNNMGPKVYSINNPATGSLSGI
jgi:hypothetical protein